MKLLATTFLAAALAMNLAADDKYKEKTKAEGVDPVTGDKVKVKSKGKVEHDGDYKEKGKVKVNGKTKAKYKVKAEPDGDYKEKVESK
jgi:ABC-type uncharacterized transport system YnjBCD substrate-binding protein